MNEKNQLNNTINRLQKENKALTEKMELGHSNLQSVSGNMEKKLERMTEERDSLKEEFDLLKSERDRKLEEMRRNFEREKEILKQKNGELQTKSKATDAKQTELILAHETNRAKWDQEKSYLLSAKEDAISELKAVQRKYVNQVKETERLKEQQKRSNWRMANK